MNRTDITAYTAQRLGRTAYHMGVSPTQLAALFQAMGHSDVAAITRLALRARAAIATDCCPYHSHGGEPSWSCGGDHP